MSRVAKHIKGRLLPVQDHIIVQDMEFGERVTSGGVIIPGDDGNDRGIRARWAQVYAVGHKQQDIKAGEWILVKHGRWTRGVDVTGEDGVTRTLRRVNNEDVFMTADERPTDDTIEMSK